MGLIFNCLIGICGSEFKRDGCLPFFPIQKPFLPTIAFIEQNGCGVHVEAEDGYGFTDDDDIREEVFTAADDCGFYEGNGVKHGLDYIFFYQGCDMTRKGHL